MIITDFPSCDNRESISSRKTKKNHKNVNFHLSKWARSYYNIEVNGHGESRRVYVCRC
jgi:hypothetical protein